MLQAKEGERTCTSCGKTFAPRFPLTHDERDDICLDCEVNLNAPLWFRDGEEWQKAEAK